MADILKVGVVGGGFVGSSTSQLQCSGVDGAVVVSVYDTRADRCRPLGGRFEDLLECNVVFVCVPTPQSQGTGTCDTSIVEKVCKDLVEARGDKEFPKVVVRSTVSPGTTERVGADAFMPEFLTEANALEDFCNTNPWVIGTRDDATWKLLCEILRTAASCGVIASSDTLRCAPVDAEVIKYARNTFLATKVAYFNEIAAYCGRIGASYEAVRHGVSVDARIGASHTLVPGPDGKRGFGGHCLPKDAAGLLMSAAEVSADMPLVRAVLRRNMQVDGAGRDDLGDVQW